MCLSKVLNFVLSTLVLTILLIPAIGIFTETDKLMEKQEKRTLAKMPDMPGNLAEVRYFLTDFNRFYNDNFFFRRQALELRSFLKVVLLGMTTHKDVIIGKDNWLFYNANQQIDDYCGLRPMSEGEVQKIVNTFEYHSALLAEVKIPYLLVVPPNKQTVYSEYLPDKFEKVGKQTRLDQILYGLDRTGNVNYVDLRKEFAAVSKTEALYFKYDTHWNQRGAFWGYKQTLEKVRQLLPEIPVLGMDDILYKSGPIQEHDLTGFLTLNWYFKEEAPLLLIKEPVAQKKPMVDKFGQILSSLIMENQLPDQQPFGLFNKKGKGRALVFRDSFGSDMVPFFGESFRESIFVWEKVSSDVLLLVLRGGFFPDIVIEEIVERNIDLD